MFVLGVWQWLHHPQPLIVCVLVLSNEFSVVPVTIKSGLEAIDGWCVYDCLLALHQVSLYVCSEPCSIHGKKTTLD